MPRAARAGIRSRSATHFFVHNDTGNLLLGRDPFACGKNSWSPLLHHCRPWTASSAKAQKFCRWLIVACTPGQGRLADKIIRPSGVMRAQRIS